MQSRFVFRSSPLFSNLTMRLNPRAGMQDVRLGFARDHKLHAALLRLRAVELARNVAIQDPTPSTCVQPWV